MDSHIFGGLGCDCPCGWKCSLLATVIQLIAPLPPFSLPRIRCFRFCVCRVVWKSPEAGIRFEWGIVPWDWSSFLYHLTIGAEKNKAKQSQFSSPLLVLSPHSRIWGLKTLLVQLGPWLRKFWSNLLCSYFSFCCLSPCLIRGLSLCWGNPETAFALGDLCLPLGFQTSKMPPAPVWPEGGRREHFLLKLILLPWTCAGFTSYMLVFISIFIGDFLEQNAKELHMSVSQASFFPCQNVCITRMEISRPVRRRSLQGMVVCGGRGVGVGAWNHSSVQLCTCDCSGEGARLSASLEITWHMMLVCVWK